MHPGGSLAIELDQAGAQSALQLSACITGILGCIVMAADQTLPDGIRVVAAGVAGAIFVAGCKRWRNGASGLRPRLALQLEVSSGRLQGWFEPEQHRREVVSADLWGELCKVMLDSPTGAKAQVIVRLPEDPTTRALVCAWFTWVSGMRNQGQ